MRIAIGQMNVIAGDIIKNFKKMEEMIIDAKAKNAEIIVFPELCITGKFIGDIFNDINFLEEAIKINDKIKELSNGIGIVFGNVFLDYKNLDNKKNPTKYNAAYFYCDKKEVRKLNGIDGLYLKHKLVNHYIFNDSRYFKSGIKYDRENDLDYGLSPFSFQFQDGKKKIVIGISDELFNDQNNKFYKHNDIDMIINISSDPWILNKELQREDKIKDLIKCSNCNSFVSVNCVGMQNTGKNICLFDGDSKIYDNNLKCVSSYNDSFKEELMVSDLSLESKIKRGDNKLLDALIFACKEVDTQFFNNSLKWIVGMSGGLDSAITSAILTLAINKDRIIGYNMSSKYNSDDTINSAKIQAQKMGISYKEGSIECMVDSTIDTAKSYGYKDVDKGLTLENIQARLRGHLLSTFASLENGVVINNGNKIEVALGYCTLYGDSIGVFSLLGDCTKVQLFDLAKAINIRFSDDVISLKLLPVIDDDKVLWEIAPSAELKNNQKDPMKWFYHDWLIEKILKSNEMSIDKIIKEYDNKTLFENDIKKWVKFYGLDNKENFINDLSWIFKMLENSVFKRIQMPPIVMVSDCAFGSGYNEMQGKVFHK
ncbi:MAG: NAD(+) synthase [Anaerorhabdus sp.]